jgi:hypothetical protein
LIRSLSRSTVVNPEHEGGDAGDLAARTLGLERRPRKMKKLLIVGGAVTGAAVIAKRLASSDWKRSDFGRLVERMPENAPPKWIFRNISAIRENTDRILQLLESEHAPPGGS